jgi:small subunit ribosomal protein S8
MTDPIADLLTRIRNAHLATQADVEVPYSKFKYAVTQLLEREGWITGLAVVDGGKTLRLMLKYHNGQPVITELRRVSRPGRRVYVAHSEIPRVRGGFGMSIVSTSRGLMTNSEARRAKLGGEIICEVI